MKKKIFGWNDFFGRKQNLLILFPVGFFLGIILGISVFRIASGKEIVASCLSALRDIEIYYPAFLCYVIWARVVDIMFYVIIVFIPPGPMLYFIRVLFLGVQCGCMITGFAWVEGFTGIAVFILGCFPHWLLYAPALYAGYDYFLVIWSGVHNNDRNSQTKNVYFHHTSSHFFKGILLLGVVVIIGMLTECYVNSFFVKLFTNFFIS
ncbi:MAG: hypothetical protein IJ291_07405 [Lachnospiraceae bacterium]|nr:hypothetical protein [Lachnospiraceae bacterium]